MEYKETLPRRGISRRTMMKRVARFKKLKGTDGGLPDSKMPGCERILYNVIGFQPPRVEKNGKQSPVGDIAARFAPLHERDQGPEEQAFDPNVRDRRQRAERRVHERIDAQNRCGGRDAAAAENSAVRSAR